MAHQVYLQRGMAAAGAVLLAAAVLPGLARADEPAATLVLDPDNGSISTFVKVKASGPCPAGSTSYALGVTGPNAPGMLFTDQALPADLIPDPGAVYGALPLFDMDNPPPDGATYTVLINCNGPSGSPKLASVALKVTGTNWVVAGPTGPTTPPTSEPPTSQPPTSQPPTSQPPTETPHPTASLSPASAAPGALVQVALTGFGSNEFVKRTLKPASGTTPAPVSLPPQAVGQDGSSTAPAKLPDDLPAGAWKLVFEGPDTGRTAEAALTVTGGTPTSQPPTSQPPTSQPPRPNRRRRSRPRRRRPRPTRRGRRPGATDRPGPPAGRRAVPRAAAAASRTPARCWIRA
ncbi:hypothetical protein ACU686_04560 [Yinghuangia aomiensis]